MVNYCNGPQCVYIQLEENNDLKKFNTALEVGDGMCDTVYTVENINKLYMRLQALEANKEFVRQELISVDTEKAQLELIKEMLQQLCQDQYLRKHPMCGRHLLLELLNLLIF